MFNWKKKVVSFVTGHCIAVENSKRVCNYFEMEMISKALIVLELYYFKYQTIYSVHNIHLCNPVHLMQPPFFMRGVSVWYICVK